MSVTERRSDPQWGSHHKIEDTQPPLVRLPSSLTAHMCSFLCVDDRRTFMRTCHEVAKEEGELTEQLKKELREERDSIIAHLDKIKMPVEQQQRLVAIDQGIKTITLQNVPALRSLVTIMLTFLIHVSSEEFTSLGGMCLTHFNDALRTAKRVHNACVQDPRGRVDALKAIIKGLVAQNPPAIERAITIAKVMPEIGTRNLALRDCVQALVKQNPPAIERAITIAKAMPEIGTRNLALRDCVQALVKQKPLAMERARELTNEISSDIGKSDAFGDIVDAMLVQNPHAIEQAREFVNSITERWRSEALDVIAEAEYRASGAKGEKS